MSELPPTAHVQRTFADVSNVPCMDGARGARGNLAVVRSVRVQPCIRPCMGLFLSRGLRRVVHLLSFVGFCSICRPFLLSRPAFHSVGARRGWLAVLTTFSAIASASGHVWTAPAVQGESDGCAKRDDDIGLAARPIASLNAAIVAAGPDVIR